MMNKGKSSRLTDSQQVRSRFDPASSKTYKLACAPIEDSDEPDHPRHLIKVFDERSMGSQESSVSSGGQLGL